VRASLIDGNTAQPCKIVQKLCGAEDNAARRIVSYDHRQLGFMPDPLVQIPQQRTPAGPPRLPNNISDCKVLSEFLRSPQKLSIVHKSQVIGSVVAGAPDPVEIVTVLDRASEVRANSR